MMQVVGWMKFYRKIQENWIWQSDEPYCMRSAWDYILLNANFEDVKIMRRGQLVEVKRGQMITSLRELSNEWKWSTGKVTRFLNRLEKENMILKKDTKNGTLLTVVNYEVYQGWENTNETPTEHQRNTNETPTKHKQNADETLTEHRRNTLKEDKEYNNIKEYKEEKKERSEEDIYSGVRERIIDYLNQKCGTRYRPDTGETKKFINGRLSEGYTEDDFYTVIDKKAEEWTGTEWEKYLKPNTLFRPANFESYVNQKIVKGNSTGNAYIDSIRDRVSAVDSW